MEKFITKSQDIAGPSTQNKESADAGDTSVDSTSTSDSEYIRNRKCGNERKRKSSVWNYFTKSADKKFAKCVTCEKECKTSGNTSKLADHLKIFHSVRSTSKRPHEQEAATASTSIDVSSPRSTLRSVSPFFRRTVFYDKTSERKDELDRALGLMIATDMQPFNIVNDSGFKSFVKLLDPRYEIPNKGTIKNKIMHKLYTEAVTKLEDSLKQTFAIAITTDCWTSVSTESYISATCHYVNSNFELITALLSVKKLSDNHTAPNIANSLTETFNEWDINDKVVCIVIDNANNMLKAAELLKKRHLPCYAHSLNLVVQDNLRIESIQNIFKKCKEIVTHLKSSTIAADAFRNEQMENNSDVTEPLKLVQEVVTRWNSLYYMIQRILQTVEHLNCTLLKLRKAPAPLTVDEITVLKDIELILMCFEEATRRTSAGSTVTISLIIPITHGIYNYLNDCLFKLITEEGKYFCTGLLEFVKKRLFSYETRSVTRISTIVDPRFKKEGFRIPDNANYASTFLEQEMIEFVRNKAGTVRSQGNGNSTKPVTTTNALYSFIEKRVAEKAKSTLIIIKRQYLERKNSNEDADPLLFWKVTGKELEPMAEISQKYFCILASSVESERTFSASGNLISDKRSRLNPKNINMLFFLNKNSDLLYTNN